MKKKYFLKFAKKLLLERNVSEKKMTEFLVKRPYEKMALQKY
jgi:hypothetical protein